jgi:hypothetical protein
MKFLQSRRRLFLGVLAAFLIILVLTRGYYRLTDDFRLANMTHPMPYQTEWEIPPLDALEKNQLDQILKQTFYYIGKGAQSYAFASEDKQYVLKFFKFKHLKPSWFVDMLPSIPPFERYRNTQALRKQRKLEGVFVGYRLAYDLHRKESGLIYIHLNPTFNTHQSVHVKDKIGRDHEIDLDPVVFIVQEKAQTMRAVINELLQKGNEPLAKHRIRQILDLYYSEYKKGIYDRDHGVMHNTGFVHDRPIHLDVGKLTKEETMKNPAVARQDLEIIVRKVDYWLSTNYPKYQETILQDMQEKLSELWSKKNISTVY